MKKEPLNTRGWALQESLLAPRILAYGTQQMIWECLECKVGESGRPVLPGERHRDKRFVQKIMADEFSAWDKTKKALTRLSLRKWPVHWTAVPNAWLDSHYAMYSRWSAIVKDYTGRNLTVQSDVLPALSGLASAFQNLLRDEYCAGLWKNDIIRGMCWRRKTMPIKDVGAIEARQREYDDSIPSSSWASVIGQRVINALDEEQGWPLMRLDEIAQTLHVFTVPKYKIVIKAPFQSIDDPKLQTVTSKAVALPALKRFVTRELRFEHEYEQQHRPYSGQKFAVVRLMQTTQVFESTVGGEDWFIPRAIILIIESTGEADQWRRVGFFAVSVRFPPDADDLNFLFLDEMKRAKWEWKEVSIV